jgi:hypothetical protein
MEVVRRGHSHGMFLLLLLDTGLRVKKSRGILKRYVHPRRLGLMIVINEYIYWQHYAYSNSNHTTKTHQNNISFISE